MSIHTNSLPKGRIAYGSETYTLGMARAAANLEVAKRENSVITYEKNYKQTYAGFDPNKAESWPAAFSSNMSALEERTREFIRQVSSS